MSWTVETRLAERIPDMADYAHSILHSCSECGCRVLSRDAVEIPGSAWLCLACYYTAQHAAKPKCGCAVAATEADPSTYPCPCGAHCTDPSCILGRHP